MLKATEDVESPFSALLNREEQTIILANGEASLSRARSSFPAAYRSRAVSLVEVLQADNNLLQVSDEKVLAQTNTARAAVSTFKAFGGGWDHEASITVLSKN